jgi:hypothetical protein
VIKDGDGWLITNSIEKANSLNLYYSSVLTSEHRIPQMQLANSCEPFAISTKIVRRRLAAIDKNKLVGPDSIPSKILKLGGEAIPCATIRHNS